MGKIKVMFFKKFLKILKTLRCNLMQVNKGRVKQFILIKGDLMLIMTIL